MSRTHVFRLFVVALMLVLGVVMAAQLRTWERARRVSLSPTDQVSLLSELADANLRLGSEVQSLQAQLAGYEQERRGAGLEELVSELNQAKVYNGLVEVSGPGVLISLDGPLNALDLQDMINELRNAGAEAIALGEHRLIVSSVVVADERGGLHVDGKDLSRPYRFSAIGDPDALETAVLRPGGLVMLMRQTYPALRVTSEQHARLVLGVHRAVHSLQHAQSVD